MIPNFYCTVFTSTYNRKELLENLYNSLVNQTRQNFEWVIVDDGSCDGTEEYVNQLIEETNQFKIIYCRQENGGKHRAINRGLSIAKGNVFAIVDSDDFLTENAMERIENAFQTIKNEDHFAGVAFQRGYNKEKPIGTTFQGDYIDAKCTERRKNNINGDKFEIFYTNILKENKFPEFSGENFLPESLVWTRIAHQGYRLRWYNDIIYICEYREGGLTDRRKEIATQTPKGYSLYIKEQVKYGNITWKKKLGYYSFFYTSQKGKQSIFEVSKQLETSVVLIAVSYCMRKVIEFLRRKNDK